MSFLLSQMSFVVSNSKLACGEALQRHRRALFIVRRYHEPRQGSCLFVSIRHGNRDPGDCEHASVCLAITHGHHVGTLDPKLSAMSCLMVSVSPGRHMMEIFRTPSVAISLAAGK